MRASLPIVLLCALSACGSSSKHDDAGVTHDAGATEHDLAVGDTCGAARAQLLGAIDHVSTGEVTVALRPVRLVRTAFTSAAQDELPLAWVSPAPRSQVRMKMWSGATTCARVMLARFGKIG